MLVSSLPRKDLSRRRPRRVYVALLIKCNDFFWTDHSNRYPERARKVLFRAFGKTATIPEASPSAPIFGDISRLLIFLPMRSSAPAVRRTLDLGVVINFGHTCWRFTLRMYKQEDRRDNV